MLLEPKNLNVSKTSLFSLDIVTLLNLSFLIMVLYSFVKRNGILKIFY